MKTVTKNLLTIALMAIVLTSSAAAAFAKDEDKNPSTFSDLSGYNMIKVKGNIKLYLSQGTKERVRAETDGQDAKVSLKLEGRKLIISAMDNQPVTVYLTVKDLVRIEACEDAVVKSSGQFNVPFLQVFAGDHAKVDLNVIAQEVYTVIKNDSSLKLSGSTAHHILLKDEASNLNIAHFAVTKTDATNPVFAQLGRVK